MGQTGSIAPNERVNIVYRPATGDAREEVELPLKLLVLGDFSGREERSQVPLEERKPAAIDKDTFDSVLKSHALELDLLVPNQLASASEGLPVRLCFESLADFSPDAVALQVPELSRLLRLRASLTALKGPLGNLPAFRKKLEALVGNPETRQRLLAEIASSRASNPEGPADESESA